MLLFKTNSISLLGTFLINFAIFVIAEDLDCNEPLILPGNGNLTSTSTRNPSLSFGPRQATLHNTHAWCADISNADQCLTADFGLVKIITSVAIQGNPNDDEFLKTFSISYGVLEGHWNTYMENNAKRVFEGNSDSGTVSKQVLKTPPPARYVRIKPETWHGHVCARLQIFGCGTHPYEPQGLSDGRIPDNRITASSVHDGHFPALRGRLHWTKYNDHQAWASKAQDVSQWLQIDLETTRFVTALATQGRHGFTQYVSSYWFSYSTDGASFAEYKDPNQARKTFQGNTDRETVVRHLISPIVIARFVRFNPITWYGHICMRVEVYSYGRDNPGDLGVDTNEIPNSQLSVSSRWNNDFADLTGRINYPHVPTAWCAQYFDTNQWFQIDIGHTMFVTGVVTQSRGNGIQQYIKSYKVLYSLDNTAWEYYKDDPQGSQVKIFPGHSNDIGYVTNTFNRDIKARSIRINPTAWYDHICLRAAVLGRRNGPLGAPVFAKLQTPYVTAYKNHEVTLKCEALGDTPITITWKHNGKVLQSKTSDTHLTLTGVTKAQEGFYTCSASNALRTNSKMFYLHVKEPFEMCSKYQSLSDGSRFSTSSASFISDDSQLNETDWYIFKDNHNYLRIPTTCVPENRCGASAPGYMQGALPTVNESIVKRKVCFHSNGNCCQYSVNIYVRNCYMFYVYNLKKLSETWKARYCAEADDNKNPSTMFHSSVQSLALRNQINHRVYEVDSYFLCMMYCNLDDKCKSFNYNNVLMTCEMNNSTASLVPHHLSARENYQYFDLIE